MSGKRSSTARDLSPIKRCAVILRGGGRCVWCESPLDDRAATVDHLVPVQAGGTNATANLVSCCRRCNSARGWGWEQAARHLTALGLDPLARLDAALAQAIRQPVDWAAAKAACEAWYPGRLAYLSAAATARGARRRQASRVTAAPMPAPPVRLVLPAPPTGRGQCMLFDMC